MEIKTYLASNGWSIVYSEQIAPRGKETFRTDDLSLSMTSKRYLTNSFSQGIYLHQKEAIKNYLNGSNICMTTGTASGKSLPFYVAAIEQLVNKETSRIIAIYPLKALGREQEDRWTKALGCAGISVNVGRIDGQVPMSSRLEILRNSRVLIATPDVIHAWLLSNLGDVVVRHFLQCISLVIVDEVHNYAGVFGSNAAFLFRRMQHIMNLLGTSAQYICASATISEPHKHLKKLFGCEFTLIGTEVDTSPKHELEIHLLEPPKTTDHLTEISNLLSNLATKTPSRFIAFVDSRKQAELIPTIIARFQDKEEQLENEFKIDHLEKLNVLPYRSGYEERDRRIIQDRLSEGLLKGVVSTSALELGIDIPFLDTGILIGVPRSSTSLHQRIGRIGRHSKGNVLVIKREGVYDEAIFRDPKSLLNRPAVEGALYLGNNRIQYIHAMCLARHGGEHDQISLALHTDEESKFSTLVNWPDGFVSMCMQERSGEIPIDLQSIKAESGEDPNHTFPLRDVESQFKVELKQGPDVRSLGYLSYSQLMREAYPGAVYYYTTQPFRVCRINPHSKLIQVRHEKRYTTAPSMLPPLVFPNMTHGNVYENVKYGNLVITECDLQIRESIVGFKERRGPNEFNCKYPLDSSQTGIYFNQQRFTRNYFTTGVVITHPYLNRERVQRGVLANLLYEAFLILIPFERRDIMFASDKHRTKRGLIKEGDKFVCIYDQTYGSLRLTGRLLDECILKPVLEKTIELSKEEERIGVNAETIIVLEQMLTSMSELRTNISFETDTELRTGSNKYNRIIMPGSKGLSITRNNEEFVVEGVFYDPTVGELKYRGKHISQAANPVFDSTKVTISANTLKEIPGESTLGLYFYETGEIKRLE